MANDITIDFSEFISDSKNGSQAEHCMNIEDESGDYNCIMCQVDLFQLLPSFVSRLNNISGQFHLII